MPNSHTFPKTGCGLALSRNQSLGVNTQTEPGIFFIFLFRKASTFKLQALPVLPSSPHAWDLATNTFRQQMGMIRICVPRWNQQTLKCAYGIVWNLHQLSKILEWFLIFWGCVVLFVSFISQAGEWGSDQDRVPSLRPLNTQLESQTSKWAHQRSADEGPNDKVPGAESTGEH